MNRCADVRTLLPEHALGVLPPAERSGVDEHLAWCAGCRKEARYLGEGAARMGSTIRPADPPPHLEDRVVKAVSRASGRRRRSRAGVTAAVAAAFVAVAAAGWGAAMAGRADRLEEAATTARRDAQAAVERFVEVARELDRGAVSEAVLRGRGAVGRAVLFDPGSGGDGPSDWVLVIAAGLPEERGPYRAWAVVDGRRLPLGRRMEPSTPGRLAAYRLFPPSTSGYAGVAVTDAGGRPVLRGGFSRD